MLSLIHKSDTTKYFLLSTVALILLASMLGVSIYMSKHASAYNRGNIMSNRIYLDETSMTENQIQKFLEDKNSRLATYSSKGTNIPNTKPASYIIWRLTQIWGINPQVILATLQKESSLVTMQNPESWRFRTAMGYGCPDSKPCNDLYYGFVNQINMASYQFRYNYEALKGNSQFADSDGDMHGVGAFACNGKTRFYSKALLPGNKVTFYGKYSSSKDTTITIANEATASFLCYTPHVGPIGETGYSGSDNLVYFYKLWFDPDYNADRITGPGSSSSTVEVGSTKKVTVKFKNKGYKSWYDTVSAPANNERPVVLMATHPDGSPSGFNNDFATATRATEEFSTIYKSDGSVKSNNHIVKPGETVALSFDIKVSDTITGGNYRISYTPVIPASNGESRINLSSAETFYLKATKTYKAERWAGKGASSISMLSGKTKTAEIQFTNTGKQPWYDSVSAPVESKRPTILMATHPAGGPSGFNGGFATSTRATEQFDKVYKSNGDLKTNDTHIVQPGETASMKFAIKSPTLSPGSNYRVLYQLVIPWKSSKEPRVDINNPDTYYITVEKPTYTGERWRGVGTSSTEMNSNTTKNVEIQFTNTGNQPWYDKVSAPTNEKRPVVLMATHPDGGPSGFNGAFASPTRATEQFYTIYKSNGSVKSNNHIVEPGETVSMKFNIKAPGLEPGDNYRVLYQMVIPWESSEEPRVDVSKTDVYYITIN